MLLTPKIPRTHAVAACLVAMLPVASAEAQDGWSLRQGRVVYESHQADRVNIHVYEAGASSPRKLTRHKATDQRPRWSPNGIRVAFFSNLNGSDDIYIVNADGSGLRRITDHPGADKDPNWMPDGNRLVFSSDRDGDENLWMLDLKSGAMEQLTHYGGGRTGGPSVSPAGDRIAYSSDQIFSWQVYVLTLENGEIERITGPIPGRCNPSWSPAGGHIVYMAGGTLIGSDSYRMTPRGDDEGRIGTGEGNNRDPEFSQDGRRLVWVSDRHGDWELYEGRGDGSDEYRVSHTPEDERYPDLFVGGR